MLPVPIPGGRYRLREVLGVGGMSVVWKATDDVLGRDVAVKILAGEFASGPDARAAVLAEAQAVAQLSHPNICTVFDYGESVQADGHVVPYIVMELLTGPSLADRLEERQLAPQEALEIAAEVAAGLAAAHAHGIVHRDVKPGNVILTPSGAKVFDFGIAAPAGAPDVAGPDGSILASLSCLAPERLLDGSVVLPASDMFGWGVLLYRLLTGNLPWPSWATLADRASAALPLPVMPGISEKIGDLYLSCLALDPDDRPTAATAAAVLQVAMTVRTPQPRDVVPQGGLPRYHIESVSLGVIADADRRLRRLRAVVLMIGLVAVLVGAVFALSNASRHQGGPTPSQPNAPPTEAPPGDVPGVTTEIVVRGIPAPAVTVVVTVGGNPPVVGPATSFSAKGGNVVVVCDTYGPRVTSVVAKPGYYPNQVSLIFAALVFFTKPADGANPSITYRLTITCTGSGVSGVTVASYIGDRLMTPAHPTPTPTTAVPSATGT